MIKPMQLSPSGAKFIQGFEKLRLVPYQDSAKVWTDGWGNTHGVVPGRSITEEAADAQFAINVGEPVNAINQLACVPLTQSQFDALVSLVFNIGANAFRNSTLLKMLNNSNYVGAADQFLRWDMAGGHVLGGLETRRIGEAAMFRTA